MRFAEPLLRGTLLRRYKRFFADVVLDDGGSVTAHCANPGSMLSVDRPGSEVWLSRARGVTRTLAYSWELIRVGDCLVGIDTGRPNRLVAEALAQNRIPELAGYTSVRREVRYGRDSRIDLLLESPGRPTCLVEVKNVTLKRGFGARGPVEFPDSPTLRGAKHVGELAEAVERGDRAVMLYVAQRPDADRLAFAFDLDPEYARAVRVAADAGVESRCYRCHVDLEEVRLAEPIPVELPPVSGYDATRRNDERHAPHLARRSPHHQDSRR
jgi:sugar fermentation stimulation protein A